MIYWVIGTAVCTALLIWLFYEAGNAPTIVDDTTLYAKSSKSEIKKGKDDDGKTEKDRETAVHAERI